LSYDIERSKRETTDLQAAFREIFPLAGDFDLPRAPCHIKDFLRQRIEYETAERTFHFVSQVTRVLCEVSPPKTHVVDMARIVVDKAKESIRAKEQLENLAELQKDRAEMAQVIREIGALIGCNHTEDSDGRQKLVACLEDVLTKSAAGN
jgi:Asp-tRNA(Asn)/Glu-tRNA(Gln) amidotransferase C subunit